jgi:hypothetical protein
LENINVHNPKEFWDHLKKLGPNIKKNIPMGVYKEGGIMTMDKAEVLQKWQTEFAKFKSTK